MGQSRSPSRRAPSVKGPRAGGGSSGYHQGVIRMWRVAWLAVGAVLVILLAEPALGHPSRSFDSCAAYRRHGGYCGDTASYSYGDRVFLRARVSPPHAHLDARVVFLRPGADHWRRGVAVPITETGRMSWSFRSSREDADQTEPWRFRFRIVNHGASDLATVFILLGE
jgi:hypothetical protein